MPNPRYTAAPLRTSRELADRAEKEFQKRPDRFRQTIVWLSFVACLGTIGWLMAAGAQNGQTIYEAGPVAPAHRFFENNCAECHTTWAPIERLALASSDSPRVTSVDDASCQKCHAGSPHYAGQTPPHDGLGCAACHREHRHDATLLASANPQCIDCHQDLAKQFADIAALKLEPQEQEIRKSKLPAATITSFSADHPDFDAVTRPDPTPLRFNHKKHLHAKYEDGKLVEGLINDRGELEDLSKDCGVCHQPDSQKLYMAPIRYEQHCQRCHGLYFDNKHFQGEVVPHGVEAATLRGFLTEKYTALALADKLKTEPAEPVRPLPGRVRGEPALSPEARQAATQEAANADSRLMAPIAASEDVARQAALRQEQVLFGRDALGGCRLCHEVGERSPAAQTASDQAGSTASNDLSTQVQSAYQPEWVIQPPEIPSQWMERSRFSHDSHRFVACTECHKNSLAKPPSPVTESELTSDVLMPSIAVCRSCHADQAHVVLPEGTAATGPGIASRCIDCHDYHDRRNETLNGSMRLDLSDQRVLRKDGS